MPGLLFDIPTMMDSMRKNIQSVATAQQLYLDTVQVLANSQAHWVGDMMKGQAEWVKTIKTQDSPEDKIGDQALIMKHTYERFQAYMRELQDMMYQSNRETNAILSKRVGHSLAEVKDAVDRAKRTRAA
jgi:phasin family protein